MTEESPRLFYPKPNGDGALFLPDASQDEELAAQAIALRNADRNGDGRLSRQEATQSGAVMAIVFGQLAKEAVDHAIYRIPDAKTDADDPATLGHYLVPKTFVLEDRPLLDTRALEEAAQRIIGLSVLPKGAEKLRLTDFCSAESPLPCQNLPQGKIVVYTRDSGIS